MSKSVLILAGGCAIAVALALLGYERKQSAAEAMPARPLSTFVPALQWPRAAPPKSAALLADDLLAQEDLAAAAATAIESKRSELMLLGATIIDRCSLAFKPLTRSSLDRSAAAASDQQNAEAAAQAREQIAALERLETRCKGFSQVGERQMIVRLFALQREVCERGDAVAVLAQATYPVCQSSGVAQRTMDDALTAVLRAPSRSSIELAVGILGGQLKDRDDIGVLHMAAAAAFNTRGSELDRLSICLAYAPWCRGLPAVEAEARATMPAEQLAAIDKQVAAYVAALKDADLAAVRRGPKL